MTGEACDNTANAGEAKPFNATWEPRCPGCGCVRCTGHTPGCRKPEPSTTQNINLTIKLDAPILEHGFRVFNGLLRKILEGQQTMSAAMQTVLDKVTALKTSEDSLIALVTGLAQQIRDNVGDQAALTALAADLDAESAKVAKAVTDNTITP